MPRSYETFTSLTKVPEVPKETQAELWTLFYIQVDGGRVSLDEASVDSLQEVVSADVGEPIGPGVVEQTTRNWMEQEKR